MKKAKLFYITLISIFALSSGGYSQDITQVTFLSELDNKPVATYGDALILFKLEFGGAAASKKNTVSLDGYIESDLLTKGMASKMTAESLKLGGSFMYLIFGSERYSYRACIANGLFSEGGSENDKMTGPELIELLSRISDMKGGK